jgi:two-component system, cell cycle sensor histidine kinase and response regulator CckA
MTKIPFPGNRDIRIVVAEDSATQREHLCQILEKLGCAVTAGANGRDALDLVRQIHPDVVITDVIMPVMGGYELCRQIKAEDPLRDTAVILVTTLSDPVDVIRGLECGADNFIIKPFDEDYLRTRVAHIVTNRRLRLHEPMDVAVEIVFSGQKFLINSDRLQILNLLLTTYETAVQRNLELIQVQNELRSLTESLEVKVRERTAKLETEIQERTRAEQALQKQTEILQSVVQSMGDALLVTDEAGRFLLSNPAAEKMLGIPVSLETDRRDPLKIEAFHTDRITPYPAAEMPLARALRGGQSDQLELFVRTPGRPDGLMISATARTIRNGDGRVRGAVVAIRDITEQKQIEGHLLRSQRMESVGALAGGIAHDLNNVLAPILMAAELLEPRKDRPDDRRFIETIASSASRGAQLVKQLLTFARGTPGEERMPLPTRHVIDELTKVARETFPKSIQIRVELARDLWTVIGDPTQIEQVLLNLCVNARDAMPQGGLLTIKAENVTLDELEVTAHPDMKPGPFVLIAVSDTGTGIPQAVLDRMFEPFFTTKERGKGTGLGLSTVLGIVRGHGGFITVQTRVGQGSTFKVFFPAEPSTTPDTQANGARVSHAGNQELILFVDDDEAIRQTAAATLERNGYRVLTAEDGVSAIACFAEYRREVALAIVELTMPLMDGFTTARALRKLGPDVRVIVAGGMEEQLDDEQVRENRVLHILRKPYKAETLLTAVHTALNLSRA